VKRNPVIIRKEWTAALPELVQTYWFRWNFSNFTSLVRDLRCSRRWRFKSRYSELRCRVVLLWIPPWRWKQYGHLKHWYPITTLHDLTTQKKSTWKVIYWPESVFRRRRIGNCSLASASRTSPYKLIYYRSSYHQLRRYGDVIPAASGFGSQLTNRHTFKKVYYLPKGTLSTFHLREITAASFYRVPCIILTVRRLTEPQSPLRTWFGVNVCRYVRICPK
jgi:hypothetical protein